MPPWLRSPMLAGRIDKESPMNWILKPWSALTTDELYELLALRAGNPPIFRSIQK